MSYGEMAFLAEEIARNIHIPQQEIIKTTEERPKTSHIINYHLTTANQTYKIKLQKEGLKAWSLKCRTKVDIQYSFEPTFSTYMTLGSGETLNEDTVPSLSSVYVKCATANVVVELEEWRE